MPASATPDTRSTKLDAQVTGVVSFAHGYSHFTQLMVAPLFPWIKESFALSYAELGLLMTVFFVASGVGQALSGFVVDRVGALPVLLGSIGLFVVAALGLAISPGYVVLLVFSGIAGAGNASFHPIDYSILNARIRPARLGHAYAVHGIAGSLGWAAAPAFMVGLTTLFNWRIAFAGAAVLAALVWLVVWRFRHLLAVAPGAVASHGARPAVAASGQSSLGFLKLPAVWLSFLFFVAYAISLGGVQSFGPEAARNLHQVPLQFVAICLTAYMLATAAGMVLGGFLVRDPGRADRVIGLGFGSAAVVALVLALIPAPGWAVPILFALMGVGAGIAGPSRDTLVRAATPPGATGRVYGMVYSGLDVGMAIAPALFGVMMDQQRPGLVWIGIAVFQGLLIVSVLKLGSAVRRPAARAAVASNASA